MSASSRSPNALRIVVTERAPFAVWRQDAQAGAREVVVDRQGHVLAPAGAEAFARLPRLVGPGAPQAAADLLAALALFPAVAARLAAAERVGERRWTLWLAPGPGQASATAVHLPATGELAALQRLADLDAGHALLATDLAAIDLRAEPPSVRRRPPSDPKAAS